jgi:ADP-heptose:LPS heptosyltransferase
LSLGKYKIRGLPVRVELLQLLDRWVFSFFCLVLTFFTVPRRLFPLTRKKPKKILLVKLAEQGSSVLAIPAIQSAIQMVGKNNVYAIVFEENRFILDVIGLIPAENIFPVKQESLFTMIGSTLGNLIAIRLKQIDAAVDLEFFARFSAAITFLSGAKLRSGLHAYFGEGPYRGDLMTHRVLYNPHIHTSQMFEVLVLALQQDPCHFPTLAHCPPLVMRPHIFQASASDRAHLRKKLFSNYPIKEKTSIILVNPNASDLLPLRKWDSDKYVQLIRKILSRYPGAWVCITGSESEKTKAEQIREQVNSKHCINIAGRTTLDELMVLYCVADILITNDSGPAHFASLTNIQTVVLFGPETPHLFDANSEKSQSVYVGLPCSPCINALNNRQTACRDNQCMKQITPDMVFDRVIKAIS